MQPLPIDPLVPAALTALSGSPNLVLTAEPGAGKTTRVPPALIGSHGRVLTLEPRRLAARLSAARVAEERGERLGGRIGYQIRFDDRTSAQTELIFLTEGILLRRLLTDGALSGVGAVVLDEFHERSLPSDLLLALLRQLQRGPRPELRLVVMSATLAAEPVAAFLGECPRLHAPGRTFPIAVSYAPLLDDRPLEERVAAAVAQLLHSAPAGGDLLVFLPGMAEIRRCAARLGMPPGVEVLPLHGTLSPEAQDRALRPSRLRKVILSTNVAETSLTIEGVTAVIDSGLARISGHSAWSGLPTLKVQKISQAAATQRAGRAGRTQAGQALRLYPKADHDGRPSQELPEIQRADLAEPVLLLHALGFPTAADFPWFEPPPVEALAQAEALLQRLGAIDGGGLTALGRRLAPLPLHPRLGRVLLEGKRRGVGREAATLVALLQERDLAQPGSQESGDSDPLWALEQLQTRRRDLDPAAAAAVARSAGQLSRLLDWQGPAVARPADPHSALRLCLLTGYPDRVARRRKPGGDELLLSGGGTALLARESVVKAAPLLVAIEAEEQRRAGASALGYVRAASAIEEGWLLDLFPEQLREERRVRFLPEAERVDVESRLFYDALVLDESRSPPTAAELEGPVAEALAAAALERGPSAYLSAAAAAGEPERTLARLAFAAEVLPELRIPPPGSQTLAAALARLAAGKRRFEELREGNLLEALLAELTPAQRQGLEAAAPGEVRLPSGRQIAVHYQGDRPPWVEARMQEFMGWSDGPRLGKGRLPLTLHLLAPNHRAVQVTSDLAGFWERHYPQARRELSRRYPRHAWPEDPRLPLPPPSPRKPR